MPIMNPPQDRCLVAARAQFAAAGMLGLCCFAASLLLSSLALAGLLPTVSPLLGVGLLYAASGQILAGIAVWRRHQAFPAVLLTAFGLFWFSRLAFDILPSSGLGTAPSATATCGFLLLWGLFALILCEADDCPRSLRLALAAVAGSLLLQAGGALLLPNLLLPLGACLGLLAAACLSIGTVSLFRAERRREE